MRKLLNRLLHPVGYRIERVSRFKREFETLVRRSRPFKFVQIGANDGVRFDGLYPFVTTHRCSGVVVEPLPDMFERLRANYADYPNIAPINAAIHETATQLSLFRVAPPAMSRYEGWASGIASFDRDHLARLGIASEDVIAQQVRCMTLMDLLMQNNMLDADLLQIDAEGYDSAILRMIDFTRFRPQIIRFEHKSMTLAEREEHAKRLAAEGYQSMAEGADTTAWRAPLD